MNRRSFLPLFALIPLTYGLSKLSDISSEQPAWSGTTYQCDRTIEIPLNGKWQTIGWSDLKQDMLFRVREDDGTLVDEGTDDEVSLALEDAYLYEFDEGGISLSTWSVKSIACGPHIADLSGVV